MLDNIFRRNSNQTLNEAVNVLYTKYGYQNLFLPFVNKRLNSIYKEEKWVIGDSAQFKSPDDVISDIYRLYSLQYVATWKSYLQDVRMVQYEANKGIISVFAKKARNAQFDGLFAVVSDPVDPLCRATFLASNEDEAGNFDGKGLRPE